MCGIIGILGDGDVAGSIVEALRRLEYRGYDSAGIATIDDGALDRRRAPGKLAALEASLKDNPLAGAGGIGHTRWATHGAPTETNAHPHGTPHVLVVHNGIIENFAALRAELTDKGVGFASETDAEVCPQLIDYYLRTENLSPTDAFRKAINRLTGAFAIVAMFAGEDDLLIGARKGSPLAIGRGDGQMTLGSDAFALAPFTNRITYLEEGDWTVVTRAGFQIFNSDGDTVRREETISSATSALVEKDGHRHFMAKEIHEQPEVIAHTLSYYIDPATLTVRDREDMTAFDFARFDRLTISACGTAFYAAQIAKYWFETLAKLPVEIDIASELRYRDIPYPENGGALFVSQSGETADTLAALKDARAHGQAVASLVNVIESSIARDSDVVFPITAGPEIGVASTKAFTCQLAALAAIAIGAGRARGVIGDAEERRLVGELLKTPRLFTEALAVSDHIEEVARDIAKASDILYVGRGTNFPLAMEGALKLKEISYIHAEGYAAGELKHGPIALIDENLPVVVIAPSDRNFAKTLSNMHEVIARDGKALLISDAPGVAAAGDGVWRTVQMPETDPLISPIIYAAPIQLLAYFTATTKGTDVDQPRNLAKSVTVE